MQHHPRRRCDFSQGSEGVETNELLYYNAITALPLLAVLVLCDGEAAAALPALASALERNSVTVSASLSDGQLSSVAST